MFKRSIIVGAVIMAALNPAFAQGPSRVAITTARDKLPLPTARHATDLAVRSAAKTLIMAVAAPAVVVDPAARIAVKLRVLTPDKLQAALNDAVATGDPYSPDCYRALQPIVQAATDANTAAAAKPTANDTINLVLIYQKLRDTRRAAQSIQAMVNGGGNVDVVKACAPMVLDSESVINQVITAIGGAAVLMPK